MSSSPSNRHRRRSTFLLIDDDDDFRTALAQNLRDDGHTVREAAGSAQLPPVGALADVALLIVQDDAFGGRGLTYADAFHRAYALVPVILLTTYRSKVLEQEVAARDFVRIITKPVDYEQLHELITHLLARKV